MVIILTAVIRFCPVCGQGMFIKEEVNEQVFECVDAECSARLKIRRNEDCIEIEYIGRTKKDVGNY